MHLFIISGTTKGLGHSLQHYCLAQGHIVLSINRKESAPAKNHFQLITDLSELSELDTKFSRAIEAFSENEFEGVHLVNNAAMIEPVGKVAEISAVSIRQHLTVNLEAPIQLCRLFLKSFDQSAKSLTVTNLSSGAATFAIPGWELYCASKSGLRLFTENLALDYKEHTDKKFMSFSPGVMDTPMQEQIRNKTEKEFSEVKRFQEMKDNGQLLSPDVVAKKLFQLLIKPQSIKQVHLDVASI